jgi:hypothetical protein
MYRLHSMVVNWLKPTTWPPPFNYHHRHGRHRSRYYLRSHNCGRPDRIHHQSRGVQMLFYLDQILLPLLAAAKIVDTTTAVAILILIFLFMIRIYNDFKQYL